MLMYDNILIDGKNIIYRAVAAARSSDNDIHPTTIFIRMMDRWRRTYKPKKWHIFWDVPKNTLWRKKIYPEYKDGRPYDPQYSKMVKKAQRVTALVLNQMKITQYIRKENEADDLIYAFTLVNKNADNLIVSSDGDIIQVIFNNSSGKKLDLHNPGKKNIDLIPVPKYDPVIIKCLSGDKADNIKNYRLVKEKTASKIIDKGLDEYLKDKGDKLFKLNRMLIDLSKNPYMNKNIDYVKSVKENTVFNLSAIKSLIAEHTITGLSAELANKIRPFKNI